MIWVSHDFYENFNKSINSNDTELMLDIFRSEVTDLLTYNSSVLFKLFDKTSIKYNPKSSYEELYDKIIIGIKENPKFVNGLSFLIADSTKTLKDDNNKNWVKVLNKITSGIKKIATYFKENPKKEKHFKIKTLEMLGTKSSITGDDQRELNKKDNTIYWILGVTVVGVLGYLLYRYFDKQKQEILRAESLNSAIKPALNDIKPDLNVKSEIGAPQMNTNTMNNVSVPKPEPILDPAYFVPPDVLIPDVPMAQPNTNSMGNSGGVQIINVQPTTPAPNNLSNANGFNQPTRVDI